MIFQSPNTIMKLHLPTIALVLTAAAGVASGQNRRGGDRQERPPMPPVPPVFAFFDADRDGELSEQEIDHAAEALARLDRNGDGRITREEMRPPKREGEGERKRPPREDEPQGPPPGGRPVPPLVAALDADKDGKISAAEIDNAPESLKELDANGDGELTPEELRPPGPPPPRFEDGPGGPPPGEDEMEVE
jgi:hypothetical protein